MNQPIGIIGGAGPLASSLLYQLLIEESYRRGRPVPEIHLMNYPFTRGLKISEGVENESRLRRELQLCIDRLSATGARSLVIACNTLHLFLDQLHFHGVALVSLPRTALEKIGELRVRRLLVLATQTTLARGLYMQTGVELVPSRSPGLVDQVIDRILEGVVRQEDSQLLSQLTANSRADGVLLGCTELSVLQRQYPIDVGDRQLFDPLQLAATRLLRINGN